MAPGRLASFIVEAPTSHSPVEWQHDEHMKATSNDIYGKCCLADLKSLNLESNFGVLDPENVGYLQPTSADTPLEIMHKRFQRDGYLFVKGCISKEASSIYREAYFNYMPPSGLLQEGSKPVDGVFSHKNSRKYLLPGNLRR
ncbi:uncharacterized protein APUU_80021A [Aspergillus puulaauensis]|uniref:Uncharacterized protein n=1 Tax=Aspergillus puulaauensis TaxID=1220207 RepID=A0A7R7XZI9_9EURO|nr:uncharacterized protein APUU_80021A [Aspergillus puulaauensis]BCS29718.1 hypothetical protein APUU_80021A [Aspergillus puulaauensis]